MLATRGWADRPERPILGLIVLINAWSARGVLAVVSWPNDLALHDAMVQWATGRMQRGHLPLDGWMPSLSGGLAQFHHYQSLPHVLTAIVGLAIGPQAALHLALWALVSTWPVTVYIGGRALGIDRRPALFAAACAPLLRSVTGYGFEPFSYLWLGNGLWSQAWGMWMAPLAIGWTVRTARTGERPVRAAVAVALTILFHLPTAWFVLLFLAGAPFLHPARLRDGLLRTARVMGAAFLGCAWFLVPFLLDRSSESRTVFGGGVFEHAYGWHDVVRWAASGELLDHTRLPLVSALALVGAVVAARRWRDDAGSREVLALGGLSLVLLCGTDPFGPLISLIPTSGSVYLHRAVAIVQLAAIWLAGWGGDGLARALAHAAGRVRRRPLPLSVRVGATAAVALLLVPAVRSTHRLYAEDRTWIADQRRADRGTGEDVGDLLALATATGGGRVYAGPLHGPRTVMVGQVPGPIWLAHRNVEAMGFPLRVSALFSDLEVLMDPTSASDLEVAGVRWVLQPASQPPVEGARFVAQRGPNQLWELPGRGMAFVADLRVPAVHVASDEIAASVLAAMRRDASAPTTVRALAIGGIATPTAITASPRGPSGAGRVEGGRIELADGRVDLEVRAVRQAVVVVRANGDPRWRATVDGRPVRPLAVTPTWVAVPVPAGRHQVELRYEPWPWTVPVLLCGWVGLVLVARGRGRRRPAPEGAQRPFGPS